MELFKLLGTIAIENAEANKALDETGSKGEQTQSKLASAFSKFGHGAAVAGKAIMTGLAVGGAAMAGLTVKALQLSGDLEQNMGGAEAVFGELGESISAMSTPMQTYDVATGQVIQATSNLETVSKQAYANMGLSQSDYLATANKMGALFKGAGFETQEALNLSSQAMQRAADVASIMGIDTESAMEAVAGAAKGNFTMMDNLGVAMNDTAIGAYALEKGINKTTAEMTQQEKIGLAMEMFLEKTAYAAGNYSKENATLAGSLGTAKAALTNFLDGSGDVEGLVTSFSNLANVVVKSISEIAPRLTTGLTDLINQVVPLLPPLINQLLPVLVEGAVTLIDGLVAALPGVLSALMNALPALIEGFTQLFDALIGALPGIYQMIYSALPELIPGLIDGISQMILTLCTMLPQMMQPIIDNLPATIISIIDALVQNLPALIEGVITLVMGIVEALPVIIQSLVDALPTIISLIVEALIVCTPQLIAGVVQIIAGLIAALPQIIGSLIAAIPAIFMGIVDAIKNVFAPIGEWFSNLWASLGNVPGLAQLKSMVEQVWNTIKEHISTVLNAVKNVVTTAWDGIKSVVSTVLNSIKTVISTAWEAVKTIISNVMKVITSVLKGDWEGVKTAISNILDAIKSVIQSIWNGIKDTISTVLNAIKSTVSSIWEGIKTVISSTLNTIKSVVSDIWNGIKSAISTVLNGIKTTVTTAWNNIKSAVSTAMNNIKSAISTAWNNIKTTIGNVIDRIKSTVSSKFDEMKSKVISVGTNIVEGIWEGISGSLSWIKSKISGWVGDVESFIKGLFGIKSPSTLMRDEVGRYIAEGIAVGIVENKNKVTGAFAGIGADLLKQAKKDAKSSKKNATATAEEIGKVYIKAAKAKYEEYKTYNEMTVEAEVEFWDEIRQQCAEGTSARIEADKNYFAAKNSIDKEVLTSAEARLNEYKVYNTMTLADEAGFWDSVRQLCTEGTEARITADQKYFEAKKAVNEGIINAESELQKSLDEIYKKIEDRTKELLNTFNLFEKFKADEKISKDDMLLGIGTQLGALNKYAERMEVLKVRIGDSAPGLYEELESMGVSALEQITTLSNMSQFDFTRFIEMYNDRNAKARKIAEDELSVETVTGIQKAYQTFANTVEGLGVVFINNRELVSSNFALMADNVTSAVEKIDINIAEKMGNGIRSVVTAIDEMQTAFENFAPKMKLPHFKFDGSFNLEAGTVPTLKVEWYKKAMDNAMILNSPTIFGYNSNTGNLMGGGEAGSEMIGGTDTVMGMIQEAVSRENSNIVNVLLKILKAITAMDDNMSENLKDALEDTGLKLNNREFARLVKAVN